MVEVELGLKRPAIIPLIIVDQELVLTVEVDIGIRPATLTPIEQVAVVNCLVENFLLVLLTKLFMVMRYYDIAAMAPRGVISVAMMVKWMGNRSRDDGYKRCDIIVDNGRLGSRSKENSHSSYRIWRKLFMVIGEVDICPRPATLPCDHGILLHISIYSRCLKYSLHENLISDSRVDDGRCGNRSQKISHSYFQNDV